MSKIKVMTVFGTRPEAIKMAPLVKELEKREEIKSIVCITAQHREMLDMVLDLFDIKADYDLDIMQQRQTLTGIITKALTGLDEVIKAAKPDVVLVHGDTSTTLAGSLAAFYNQVKLGHVEAGLRTYDKYSPFPEEMNRTLTGNMADYHFAPTISNKQNLLLENIKDDIYITGNTVIDSLKYTVHDGYKFRNETLANFDFSTGRVILVTAHRRENLGKPLEDISKAILRVVNDNPDISVIYPVHLNPAVRDTVFSILGNHERIKLIAPLDVDELHNLMNKSYLVMTDSGGLQEEAPAMGKPVIVLREETERPEAVDAGTVVVSGCNEENIYSIAMKLLNEETEYKKMAKATNPYGDGHASERIVDILLYKFGKTNKIPNEFM